MTAMLLAPQLLLALLQAYTACLSCPASKDAAACTHLAVGPVERCPAIIECCIIVCCIPRAEVSVALQHTAAC